MLITQVLIRDSRENLRELLKEFDIFYYRTKLKVKAVKSKVMVCAKTERWEHLNLRFNREILKEVDFFNYL